MCNWARREIAKGIANIPSYTPYLARKLSSSHWLPDISEQRISVGNLTLNSRQEKRNRVSHELPIQSRLLSRGRFLLAAEWCSGLRPFGGLCSQLNFLAVVLNLCVAEGVNLGLPHFRIQSARLEGSTRARAIDPSACYGFLSAEQLGVKKQARRELPLSFWGGNRRFNPRRPTIELARQSENSPNFPSTPRTTDNKHRPPKAG